jgi:hypothetical protein
MIRAEFSRTTNVGIYKMKYEKHISLSPLASSVIRGCLLSPALTCDVTLRIGKLSRTRPGFLVSSKLLTK